MNYCINFFYSPFYKKASSLFSQPTVQCEYEDPQTKKKMNRVFLSSAAGILSVFLAATTGVTTAVHEVLGHGFLGFKSVYNYYWRGSSPTYTVIGWENFKDIGKAHSFGEGITAFFRWILGMHSVNGADGWANRGSPSGNTDFGKALGAQGRDVWISLTGSIPMLVVDAAMAALGGHWLAKGNRSRLAPALLSFACTDNLINSLYPLDAAIKTPQVADKELPGHDFANVALKLSNIIHIPAEAIAIGVAGFWMTGVPFVGLASYFATRGSLIHSISDTAALSHWLSTLENHPTERHRFEELEALYYKKQPKLFSVKGFQKAVRHHLLDPLHCKQYNAFFTFLMEQIPRKVLNQAKQEILDRSQMPIEKHKVLFFGASVLTTLLSIVTSVLHHLALWGMSGLGLALDILKPFTSLGLLLGIFGAAYQVHQDCFINKEKTPTSVKAISLARFGLTIISTALSLALLFLPFVNLIVIGAVLLVGVINVVLSMARTAILIRRFKLAQATEPSHVKIMQKWLSMFKKRPLPTRLKKWVALVRSDPKTASLVNSII
ncbi:MAG: hypothetical protein RLZZ453_826 [Chlamydiota bacterium]|jgi:hypothetical protein